MKVRKRRRVCLKGHLQEVQVCRRQTTFLGRSHRAPQKVSRQDDLYVHCRGEGYRSLRSTLPIEVWSTFPPPPSLEREKFSNSRKLNRSSVPSPSRFDLTFKKRIAGPFQKTTYVSGQVVLTLRARITWRKKNKLETENGCFFSCTNSERSLYLFIYSFAPNLLHFKRYFQVLDGTSK